MWGGGKIYVFANITVNLIILGVFKYYNFFVNSFVDAFNVLGLTLHTSSLNLILPVGISFYTFQALSYTIDVYRGKLSATHDPISFFAFISFFPQLVAGPIERATNLLPQFQKERAFNYDLAVEGTRQILWGLFKKMVIADRCALEVNDIFTNYSNYDSATLITGALLFTFQIYGDFSGYSDIAIGTGKLFGIRLIRNFNLPYFSKSISEFWKRWHISLNTWFVDYVYIPLGGSRNGKIKTIRNTIIIFLLSGLWHGANWTYVSWGIYHAILFVPLLVIGKSKVRLNDEMTGLLEFRENFHSICKILLTFILVVIGWVIFRSESMDQCFNYFSCMLANSGNEYKEIAFNTPVFICLMVIVEWLSRYMSHPMELFNCGIMAHSRMLRWGVYVLMAYVIIYFAGRQATFIYFQF